MDPEWLQDPDAVRDRLYKNMKLPLLDDIQRVVKIDSESYVNDTPHLRADLVYDFVTHFTNQFFQQQHTIETDK